MKPLLFALALGASALQSSTAAQASCSAVGLAVSCTEVNDNIALDATALVLGASDQAAADSFWASWYPSISENLRVNWSGFTGHLPYGIDTADQPTFSVGSVIGSGISITETFLGRTFTAHMTVASGKIISAYATFNAFARVSYDDNGEAKQITRYEAGTDQFNLEIPVPGPEAGTGLAALAAVFVAARAMRHKATPRS